MTSGPDLAWSAGHTCGTGRSAFLTWAVSAPGACLSTLRSSWVKKPSRTPLRSFSGMPAAPAATGPAVVAGYSGTHWITGVDVPWWTWIETQSLLPELEHLGTSAYVDGHKRF